MQINKTDFKDLFIFIEVAMATASTSAIKKPNFTLLICLLPFFAKDQGS